VEGDDDGIFRHALMILLWRCFPVPQTMRFSVDSCKFSVPRGGVLWWIRSSIAQDYRPRQRLLIDAATGKAVVLIAVRR
jgi:hypothetical protein